MHPLKAVIEQALRRATDAVAELREALALDGAVLPSLCVDSVGEITGIVLVDLGRIRPDVAVHLAGLVRDGVKYRAQQKG
ncbi:hypothetical protein P3T37_007150 [Kitasatospora sp. MAA4]|uniref:hypothetical protein n=1 Tax=Kitasatospora sp. MAA4 TaxID=3035093 RepID=UPI002473490E|nr:hypothetical protein [Kitasatospora sp. MAA4]MDH6137717.1 hypothetical protein [Kitasatospora sp. MAA4]